MQMTVRLSVLAVLGSMISESPVMLETLVDVTIMNEPYGMLIVVVLIVLIIMLTVKGFMIDDDITVTSKSVDSSDTKTIESFASEPRTKCANNHVHKHTYISTQVTYTYTCIRTYVHIRSYVHTVQVSCFTR